MPRQKRSRKNRPAKKHLNSKAAKERFGERAVRMGFVTEEQVHQALERQWSLAAEGRPHMLIGLVLLEMGAISNDRLIRVLKSYEEESGTATP